MPSAEPAPILTRIPSLNEMLAEKVDHVEEFLDTANDHVDMLIP